MALQTVEKMDRTVSGSKQGWSGGEGHPQTPLTYTPAGGGFIRLCNFGAFAKKFRGSQNYPSQLHFNPDLILISLHTIPDIVSHLC